MSEERRGVDVGEVVRSSGVDINGRGASIEGRRVFGGGVEGRWVAEGEVSRGELGVITLVPVRVAEGDRARVGVEDRGVGDGEGGGLPSGR